MNVLEAQERLIRAALRVLSAERPENESYPYNDAEAEYAGEQLALAARDLFRAVDASENKPIGW